MIDKIASGFALFIILCALLGFAWACVNYYDIKDLRVRVQALEQK